MSTPSSSPASSNADGLQLAAVNSGLIVETAFISNPLYNPLMLRPDHFRRLGVYGVISALAVYSI
jgi:hypothetical protein